jgi:CelD/BcsL family acetyltransferase involved in cellulose biosynthesis
MAWLFAAKRDWVDRKAPKSRWLSASGTEELFTAAAAEGLSSGRTWLTGLSVNGATIAAMLSFCEGRTLFFSKTAFDPAWQHLSPGRTLLLLNIERGFAEKMDKFDLMIGEGFGKERLADQTALVVNRRIRLRHPAGP